MGEDGLDGLLLSVGADLPYFTGYQAMPLERLTMAVIPREGRAVMVVPELEAPRVEPVPDVFDVRPWGETEDPIQIVADMLDDGWTIAIGEQTWAVFLLGLQDRLPGARFVPSSPLTRQLRMRKDEGEIASLRKAGYAADRVAAHLADMRFSGRTEREVSRLVQSMLIDEGHETADFAIVASGPNGASPHHEAGDRVITQGDAVVVDFGGLLEGYSSDTTRNFHVGEPSDDYRAAFAVLHHAQEAAVAAARPGVTAESVDAAARRVIEAAGYGEFFIHRTGHGIGLEVHEHPYIVAGNDLILEQGMAFSIEPGIYLPGRWGMRIEDICVVTADGVERLNLSSRRVAVVE